MSHQDQRSSIIFVLSSAHPHFSNRCLGKGGNRTFDGASNIKIGSGIYNCSRTEPSAYSRRHISAPSNLEWATPVLEIEDS
jgi:hypothetical protein